MSENKFCIDCTHSKLSCLRRFCKHPESDAWQESLVDGSIMPHFGDTKWNFWCETERSQGVRQCGIEGTRFEEKVELRQWQSLTLFILAFIIGYMLCS